MAKDLNKVMIIGRLGQDPEVKYMNSGDPVTNLSVATSDNWKDKQGQNQERTEWHRVSIFGKLAEIAGEYLRKGSQVYIEGKLQTRKWQDKDGSDRYTTEIVLNGFDGQMQMLGGKNDGGSNQQSSNANQSQRQQQNQGNQQNQNQGQSQWQANQNGGGFNDNFDDDVIF